MNTFTVGEVMAAFTDQVWAIDTGRGAAIERFLRARLGGDPVLSDADVTTLRSLAGGGPRQRRGVVGVIPIYGLLTQHDSIFSMLFGGMSYDAIAAAVDQFAADPAVGKIVLDVDSGGGSAQGADELSARIFAARDKKRIVAISNHVMASAAYWVASAAHEVVGTPSSLTGSLGVYLTHTDTSEADAKDGIKTEVISFGKYKAEGVAGPLTEEARAAMQATVDGFGDLFMRAVARNRGDTPGAVAAGYGEGRVLMARSAKAASLIDRIATFDEVAAELPPRSGQRGASADTLRRRLALDVARTLS